MVNQVLSLKRFAGFLAFAGVAASIILTPRAKAPEAPPKHGLTGNYYVGSGGWYKDTLPATGGFLQIWTDQSDFSLPRTFTAPATTRVDAQVAFGQGKGFSAKSGGPPVIWWPTGFALPPGWTNPNAKPWDQLAAVIWKGYIHLPKAGTYYFGLISNGPSAVYLNQARVALSGLYGGVLVSDAFTFPKEDVQNFVQNLHEGRESVVSTVNPREQYVVPVSVDAPRDFPIEVHYNPSNHFTHWASEPFGIDLFWVTPDSPHDANGKPITHIVPSEALYTEAPGPVEKPVVRSANSTISADFLYFPAQGAEGAVTLTIRLADKDGNPVPGKRVYVNSLNEWNADTIVQPDKPTDKNGETTAKIRANATNPVAHDSAIFATDVTDLVDAAQVAHVTFQQAEAFFFPDAFSPYYDPNIPSVEPLPLRVGHAVTIKAPLVNRNKFTAEVTVTFSQNAWNIGASGWSEIGTVKNVRLQPGEHKDVSISWTPEQTTGHVCFRVDVTGHVIAAARISGKSLTASVLPPMELAAAFQTATGYSNALSGKHTHNIGPVSPPVPIDSGGPRIPPHPRPIRPQGPKGPPKPKLPPCGAPEFPESGSGAGLPPAVPVHPEGDCKPNKAERMYCEAQAEDHRRELAEEYRNLARALAKKPINVDDVDGLLAYISYLERVVAAFERCANDPRDSAYQRLAVAASDTPDAYLEAMTKSWERYQGAEAAGDTIWMSRHFTAQNLYFRHYVDALRAASEAMQKQAESLPPDDPATLAKLQAAGDEFFERWRQGHRFTPGELKLIKQGGLSEQEATEAMDALAAEKESPPPKTLRTILLEAAAQDRQSADEAGQITNLPANLGEEGWSGQVLMETYAVANPHDKEENVDLFVRPISIPPDWRLSILNAEEDQTAGGATKQGTQPKYRVREVEPGKHYTITLPAKTETKVASVLIPVGEIGARTTARWAVEGKIGNELIGGMVHEMNVPYIIADLQLPPVGSKEVEEELPVPSRNWTRIAAEISAGIVLLGLLTYFFILWRRRRRTTAT